MLKSVYLRCFILSLIAISATSIGCGGGVSGTGGQRFEGDLTSEDLKGLPNVQVTLLETGQVTSTSPDGLFVFETPDDLQTAIFRFDSPTILNKTADVPSIPSGTPIVRIKFTYHDPSSEIQVDDVTFSMD